MNTDEPRTVARVAELQQAFDRSFAEARSIDVAPQDDLLAIRVGTDPYAVRLTEVGGLFADKHITWVPGSVPELLGLVGLRGTILPVYDLRALLGYSKAGVPRWLLVVAHTQVSLAFDQFDGHLRVPREAIASDRSAEARPPHIQEVVHSEGLARPVLHIASVLEAIGTLGRQAPGPKE